MPEQPAPTASTHENPGAAPIPSDRSPGVGSSTSKPSRAPETVGWERTKTGLRGEQLASLPGGQSHASQQPSPAGTSCATPETGVRSATTSSPWAVPSAAPTQVSASGGCDGG